jgi:hypothetical protein
MFHIGQEVVCVDDAYTNSFDIKELQRGNVYHIAWVGMKSPQEFTHLPGKYRNERWYVHVAEVMRDTPLAAARFRPLNKTKKSTETGVTILKGLLETTKPKAPVKEDA